MSLADLLTQTTPGPWRHVTGNVGGHEVNGVYGGPVGEHNVTRYPRSGDARLVALTPDLAKLAIDMAEQLGGVVAGYENELAASVVPLHGVSVYVSEKEAALIGALLARFAALDQRATTGGPAVNAIERLRAALDGDPVGIPEANDALAAVDALYQAAKRHADNTGSFNALAAAVRRVEGDQ